MQLSRELAMAGRKVTLAVGTHGRCPRRYRGKDISHWLDATGITRVPWRQVDDLQRVRRTPSLTLIGTQEPETLDLNSLQALGVEITGRMSTIRDGHALFSGGLRAHVDTADLKMNRLLDTIDAWIESAGLDGQTPPPERFAATQVPDAPRLDIDLVWGPVSAIVWATGYVPDHSWLQMPVFDRKGALIHEGGIVAPGLYAMGLPYLRTRRSTFIAGATEDAQALAHHLFNHTATRHAA
jgi:putative flavoprotein involved in K+ transport